LDLINELGELAFASRLKRLSERLMKDVTRIYRELDVDFEARWFPIMYSLKLKKSMSITELAGNLSLTHPAVNQLSAEMEKAGLIASAKDRRDERRRLLRLTAQGKKTVKLLEPVWEDIKSATGELLNESRYDLIASLAAIEKALDEKEIYDRVRTKIVARQVDSLVLEDYRPKYKKYFRILNYQWLDEYFKVEPSDERILNNPKKEIIDKGGEVYFALLDKKVVGTCALIRHDSGVWELAKMAVDKDYRGFGVGEKMLAHVEKQAGSRGAKELWLATSPQLAAAVSLYAKHGFKRSNINPLGGEGYQRCTIIMVNNLTAQPKT